MRERCSAIEAEEEAVICTGLSIARIVAIRPFVVNKGEQSGAPASIAYVARHLYHTAMHARTADGGVTLVLGVGNAMKGDDGVGPLVAAALTDRAARLSSTGGAPIEAIDCGTTPENYTGVLRRLRPAKLIVVDAAEMGLEAGQCRVIPHERAGSVGMSTHSMPLSLFVSYVQEMVGSVTLIGVQPQSMRFGARMSPEVAAAAERLVSILTEGREGEIEALN
jgi:hydrogenase 3 maturation protease